MLRVYELYPNYYMTLSNYGPTSPGYYSFWFHGDMPGRHILLFTVDNRPSNYIAVDVV
jgi:hypothetical protein